MTTSTTVTSTTTSVTGTYTNHAVTTNTPQANQILNDTIAKEKLEKCQNRLKYAQSYLESVNRYPMMTPMLFRNPTEPAPDLEIDRRMWAIRQVELASIELESAKKEYQDIT